MDFAKMLKDALYQSEHGTTKFDRELATDKVNNLLDFAGLWLTDKEQDEIIAIYDEAMEKKAKG